MTIALSAPKAPWDMGLCLPANDRQVHIMFHGRVYVGLCQGCAIGDGSTVQFSAVYTVDPWGGVGALGACSVVLAEVFVNMKLC